MDKNEKIQLINKYENEIIKIKNINKELLKSLATSKKENEIMSLENENKIKYIEKEYERILEAKSLEFEYNKEKMENDNKLEIERIISEYEEKLEINKKNNKIKEKEQFKEYRVEIEKITLQKNAVEEELKILKEDNINKIKKI